MSNFRRALRYWIDKGMHQYKMRCYMTGLFDRPRWRPPYGGESFETTIRASRCESWISEERVPSTGPLNLEATAAKLDARVDLEYDSRNLEKGRTTDVWTDAVVHARSNLSRKEQRITIAHELGHMYMEKVLFSATLNNDDEIFCEYFGHSLAVPKPAIEVVADADAVTIVELADEHEVSEEAVILRLMFAKKLPPKLRVRSSNHETICCLGCGSYGYVDCNDFAADDAPLIDFSGYTQAIDLANRCLTDQES